MSALFVQPRPASWWLNRILVEYSSQNEAKLKSGEKKKRKKKKERGEKVGRYSVGDYAANAVLRSAEEKRMKMRRGRARRNCGWSIMSASCKYSSDSRYLVSVVRWGSVDRARHLKGYKFSSPVWLNGKRRTLTFTMWVSIPCVTSW